ncbi:lectin [Danio aesculapii]|uniref:lectin n=1 Tax=Danio aesculapii TaxID=1142201 RepID=UPI0024C01E21|nr:lectin [Danio aesculapii]
MWKAGSIGVLLVLLFGSGNFFKMERGFHAGSGNATEWCSMPKACDMPGFSDWFRVGKHCVKYFFRRLNFTQAEFNCRTKAPGAHLASVHSLQDNSYLLCIVKKFNPKSLRIWLGAYEFFKSGQFFWLDGSFWNFNLWVPGEPNHMYTSNEECLEMSWKETGKWNDDNCNVKKSYICAFKRKEFMEIHSE